MHLQGKELVSLSTQRSARGLTVTSLVIVLARHYEVLPSDLELVGVTINQKAVSGAIFWVVGFQAINHLVHWWGDLQSIKSWNTKEKVNGASRYSAASDIISKLDSKLENLDILIKKINDTGPEENKSDEIAKKLKFLRGELLNLKSGIKSYRTFSAFYFFGWYLAFPLLVAIVAICWPQDTEAAISVLPAPHG